MDIMIIHVNYFYCSVIKLEFLNCKSDDGAGGQNSFHNFSINQAILREINNEMYGRLRSRI